MVRMGRRRDRAFFHVTDWAYKGIPLEFCTGSYILVDDEPARSEAYTDEGNTCFGKIRCCQTFVRHKAKKSNIIYPFLRNQSVQLGFSSAAAKEAT